MHRCISTFFVSQAQLKVYDDLLQISEVFAFLCGARCYKR